LINKIWYVIILVSSKLPNFSWTLFFPLKTCYTNFVFHVHTEITDKQIKNNDDFVWAIEVPLTGKFIIDVEFLDLKTASPEVGIYLLFCVFDYQSIIFIENDN
jgi:hypothetical protein